MPIDPSRVRAAFLAAVEAPDPAARAAAIDRECGPDDELRRRVEALLRAHDQPDSLLDDPAPAPAAVEATLPVTGEMPVVPGGTVLIDGAAAPARPLVEGPGSIIGPYKLLQKIGEGGMGVVFLAEQEKPVRRKVALKVIKPGMDSAQVVARFEAERQALALMDHPNIARVLDAGATDTGRPYFVMELVHGAPITRYCDEARLSPKDRLELFTGVCSAIQHAHQKGIIHRDIKPSNVLVTMIDGKAVPKVIDFGVAKAIEQPLTERSMFTQFGAIVGTLEYMSPEQAELSGTDVDTRADIYALGVLLYELLTGTTPLERARLREAGYSEILRRIREEEPPRPSTRLSDSGEALASIAATRGVEPARLTRLVRGDLDWIVMKALEKDRSRRYETANGLARDIRRHLDGDPVEACPPSRGYRLRKFARKHRAALATASAFAALLVAATAVSVALALLARSRGRLAEHRLEEVKRAKDAVDKANEVLGSIFLDLDPHAEEKEDRPLRVILGDRLDRAASELDARAIDDPATLARLQSTLGKTLDNLGAPEKAVSLLSGAVLPAESRLGADALETLDLRNSLAMAHLDAGRAAEAVRLQEETARRSLARWGPDHPKTLRDRNNLGLAYLGAGRTADALAMLRETLARRDATLGPDHPQTLITRNNLATACRAAGLNAEAIRLHKETLRLLTARRGADHTDTLISRTNLSAAYLSAGRVAEAIALNEEALGRITAKIGPDHHESLAVRNNLAEAYRVANRVDEAIALHEQNLRLDVAKLGADHPSTLRSRFNVAQLYRDSGRIAEAVALFEESLRLATARLGADHPDTLNQRHGLAMAYYAAGRYAEAIAMAEGTLRLRSARLGADHPDTLATHSTLAEFYRAAGRAAEAITTGEEALRRATALRGADHETAMSTRNNLAMAYQAVGRHDDAIAMLRELQRASAARFGPDHPNTLAALNNLAQCYYATGRTADAIATFEDVLRRTEATRPADHPETLTSRNNLASAYRASGRVAEAISLWEAMLPAARRVFGPDHPNTRATTTVLADADESLGRWAAAEPLRRELLARLRKSLPPASPELSSLLAQLGLDLLNQSKWADAEPVLRECLAIRARAIPDHWSQFNAMSLLGGALTGQGKYAEAEPLVVAGYEGLKAREATIPAQGLARLSEAAARVVALYESWGKPEPARDWRARLGLATLPADVFARP
jgi:serine/threonine protein kinase/tetratricopeptide (TPR) repeat protein